MVWVGVIIKMKLEIKIRKERAQDSSAVEQINKAAFETAAESKLVTSLRQQARPFISLVAQSAGNIIGHIMFSPVTLGDESAVKIMGLAPMAVLPEHQRKGIGTELVRVGLDECRKQGFGAVVVLGHPDYYPRFGFVPAIGFGIGCEYDVPENVFMAIELQPGYLNNQQGKVKYHEAFESV